MMRKIDKRERAAIFRERLAAAMARAGFSRAALGRATGADRSTISQLLGADAPRLPGAQLAADCATSLGVSTDWLLGLTDRPERPADVLAAAMETTEAARSSADAQLFAWHEEASGRKIRHVPATLPDMLKTEEALRWEYAPSLGKTPDQAIGAMQDRLRWLRDEGSDYEIALPRHELESFARGEGYYAGLDAAVRARQLARMAALADELYPALRLHLFDARRAFSAPVTVFGAILAVIYVGRVYLAFREPARIRTLARHFDWLVREAEVDARDAADWISALKTGA